MNSAPWVCSNCGQTLDNHDWSKGGHPAYPEPVCRPEPQPDEFDLAQAIHDLEGAR